MLNSHYKGSKPHLTTLIAGPVKVRRIICITKIIDKIVTK